MTRPMPAGLRRVLRASANTNAKRRTTHLLFSQLTTMRRTVVGPSDVVNYAYTQARPESCRARLQRAAVERVAGAPVSRATTSAAARRWRAGGDELDHGGNRRVLVRRGARRRPDHERHLALRWLPEPLGEDDGRLADDLLVELRQLAADGDRAGRDRPRQGSPGSPAGASAIRTQPSGAARRASSLPERRPLLLGPGDVADEPVLLAGEAARDERGLDGGRPRQDGHGDTCGDAPRRRASRPGSLTPGRPASETSAIRSPASSRGMSSATRVASLCWW